MKNTRPGAGEVGRTGARLALAICCVAATGVTAEGYALYGRFTQENVPVSYTVNFDRMPFGNTIHEAAEKWSNKQEINFAFRYAGKTNGWQVRGKNNVYMDDGRMGRGVLGLTWRYGSSRSMSGFHIALNGKVNFSRVQFLNTAIHEFGHALGLDHTRDWSAMMNPGGGSGDRLTDLAPDDIAGAAKLYPPTSGGNQYLRAKVGKPSLVSPKGEIQELQPTFVWTAGDNATSYEIAVDKVANGKQTKVIRSSGLKTTQVTSLAQLEPRSTYYWWVQAVNGADKSGWVHGSFSVGEVNTAPAAPKPIAPTGTIEALTPTFSWSASPRATSYELAIDRVDAGGAQSNFIRTGSLSSTELQLSLPLTSDARYYFWVRAGNAHGQSPWSEAGSFRVAPAKPGKPVIVAPLGVIAQAKPLLQWKAADHATSYELALDKVDRKRTQSRVFRKGEVRGTSLALTDELEAGATYHLWIRAVNSVGKSAWSETGTFRLAADPPGLVRILSPQELTDARRPTVAWSEAENATHYQLRLDQAGGSKLFEMDDLQATNFTPPVELQADTSYVVWVRAFNGELPGRWAGKTFFLSSEDVGLELDLSDAGSDDAEAPRDGESAEPKVGDQDGLSTIIRRHTR